MNEQSEHLTDAQVESYGEVTSGAGREAEAVEEHLAECPACRERLLKFHRADMGLPEESGLAGSTFPASSGFPEIGSPNPLRDQNVNTATTSACPHESDLRDLAAGVSSEGKASWLTQHAATCDRCGALLRTYAEDFSEDLSEDEEALLQKTKGALPEWHKQTAREMMKAGQLKAKPGADVLFPGKEVRSKADATVSETRVPTFSAKPDKPLGSAAPRSFPWKWVFVPATAAVCGLIALGIWYQRRDTPEKVERLLAQAYTEQRTMEMRWPGADWAAAVASRGPEPSLSSPLRLQEAEIAISKRLRATPTDVVWLQRDAEAQLLRWKPEPALENLNRVRDSGVDTVRLAIDLALGYFERAERSSNPADYGIAADLLGQVLVREPENRVALFNRALIYEKTFLYHEASLDWERFLHLENGSEWSNEARSHLEAIRRKLENQKDSTSSLLAPSQFVAAAGTREQQLVPQLEEYFEVALSEWVPEALPQGRSQLAGPALNRLSDIVRRHQADEWLHDFLENLNDPGLSVAILELSKAFKANARGDTASAKLLSHSAVLAFRQRGNRAGRVFAEFESAYAEARSGRGAECLARLRNLDHLPVKYFWLRLQYQNERAICLGMIQELTEAEAAARHVLQHEAIRGFPILELRALGILASIETAKGNSARAWALNLDGLARYWHGNYPVVRAYQFYDGLSYWAEGAQLNFLVLAIARESVAAISLANNKPSEAMARYQLGKAAFAVGRRDEAHREFARADKIFRELPASADLDYYRVDGQISIAKIEVETNQHVFARSRLSGLKASVDTSGNYTIKLRFYKAAAELALKEGSYAEAETQMLTAASIGEEGLIHLETDTDRAAWDQEARSVYRELAGFALAQGRSPETALQLWEWYKAASLRAAYLGNHSVRVAFKPSWSSVEQFSAALPINLKNSAKEMSRSTVVSYMELRDRIVAWVFDDRGVETVALPVSPVEAGIMARRFARECADPSSDLSSLQSDAHKLYQKMIQPIYARLERGRTLVIEADGELAKVPVKALVDESGIYLGERYRVVLSPGTLFTIALPDTEKAASTLHAVSVGLEEVPLSSELTPLPDAAGEARMVGGHFARSTVFIDRAATRHKIVEALPGAEIFHFAGHAIKLPSGVGLLLHDEGSGSNVISADQLRGELLPRCLLAVLSACSTEGPIGSGMANPESLARAFLRSGVPHVIATSWSVDSRSTAMFMNVFYSRFTSTQNLAAAMQEAATEVRNRPGTAHPFYWAAFDLFGKP